jgi:hypothetical protein
MIVNCWEESGEYPNGSTCMLLDGHDGPHEFTPDSEIVIGFYAAEAEE